MREYSAEQQDSTSLGLTDSRVVEIEKALNDLREDVSTINDQIAILVAQIRDTQNFVVKLAKNQSEVTKRVSQWPYIAVRGDPEE